jgi:hypothetical protein
MKPIGSNITKINGKYLFKNILKDLQDSSKIQEVEIGWIEHAKDHV